MGTMNISLPDSLKSFVDEQVSRDVDEALACYLTKANESAALGFIDIDVWRVLHGQRDNPAWMLEPDVLPSCESCRRPMYCQPRQ